MAGKFKPSGSGWRNPLAPLATTRLVASSPTTFVEGSSREPNKTLEKDDSESDTDTVSVSSEDDYDGFGDDDISGIIRDLDLTQLSASGDEHSPRSSNTSERNFDSEKPIGSNNVSSSPPASSSIKEDPASPICLSPPQLWQNIFTKRKLPYGAQYEISRLVSHGKLKYEDMVLENVITLAKMETNQKAAPATAKIMLLSMFEDDASDHEPKISESAFEKEHAAKRPWEELDREEEALRENPYRGLGFDENNEPLGWHGGKVLFHAKLINTSRDSKIPTYKLTLEPAELSFSHNFARRFGSKHFLRLKLTKAVLNKSDKLLDYLRRPLILCGSVFRAFFAKSHNIFYVKTNEGTNGNSILSNAPVPGVMSFLDFINWHNPLHLNSEQKMSKYASRFALGLSNSKNNHVNAVGPDPDKSNMTDGAGKTNRWTLKRLRHRIDWEDKPTAIQTRVQAAKQGLLVEDIRNVDDFSYVELTGSQRKIIYPSGPGVLPDPAHCVIDVLRSSHVRTPCRLSVETIINLSENGVPKTVFLDLLHQGLEELVEPILEWDGPNAMRNLWCKMCRLGGVMSARRAREDPGLARVKGYAYSEHGLEEGDLDDDEGDLFDATEEENSSAWWRDEISGCPSSLEETVMCLIDSGFTPQDCPILRSMLERVIKSHVKNFIKAYKINVPMSASGFLIPDTLGVLGEREIFFKHSRSEFQTPDGLGTDVLLGNVLVTRYPCKLPTDVQKWKAVDKLELHHLVDVVVLSTKGNRRAADYLSGGDYDGDKGLVIFQPEVVEGFKEPPLHYSKHATNFVDKYFKREKDDVAGFLAQVASLDDAAKIHKLQEYLLGAVRDTSVVGKYSNFHGAATYILGYTHPETIRLAYMFCTSLDGLKNGMAVKEEVLKEDSKAYQKRSPEWKETEEERSQFHASCRNEKHLQRPNGLGQFIMDELYEQAKGEKDFWLAKIQSRFESKAHNSRNAVDEDLVAPWDKAREKSRRMITEGKGDWKERELDEIEEHVRSVYKDHRRALSPKKSSGSQKSSVSFTELPIETRQNEIRKLSKKFVSFPPPKKFLMDDEEIVRVRASYAYKYDYGLQVQFDKSKGTGFPWDVAMRELGDIKARATGGHKTVVGEFYDHFNIKNPRN